MRTAAAARPFLIGFLPALNRPAKCSIVEFTAVGVWIIAFTGDGLGLTMGWPAFRWPLTSARTPWHASCCD